MNRTTPFYRAVAILTASVLFWNPVISAAGGLVVDPSAGGIKLGSTANGIPVVNIATPSPKGLSHNKFDVTVVLQ